MCSSDSGRKVDTYLMHGGGREKKKQVHENCLPGLPTLGMVSEAKKSRYMRRRRTNEEA